MASGRSAYSSLYLVGYFFKYRDRLAFKTSSFYDFYDQNLSVKLFVASRFIRHTSDEEISMLAEDTKLMLSLPKNFFIS